MSLKGSKRIRTSTVINWLINNKGKTGTGVALAISLVFFLFSTGLITIIDTNTDMACAGTSNDLCVAVVEFTANTDIFIYPGEEWGLDTDKPIKNLQLYRTWGFTYRTGQEETIDNIVDLANSGSIKGFEKIDLSTTCKSTRCGGKSGTTDNKYAYALRKGKTYTFIYTAEKDTPTDTIEWSFGYDTPIIPHTMESDFVDPAWTGHNSTFPGVDIYGVDNGTHYLSYNETEGNFSFDYSVTWPLGYNITTFNDSTTSKTLPVNSTGTETYYIQIPKLANVTSMKLTLTGVES